MADSLVASLSSLSISSASAVSHAAPAEEASWASQLPEGVLATKTLLFKPKAAKTAAVKPVLVVALDSTDVGSSGVLAKEIGIKEMRAAGDDVWQEWLGAAKETGE
jgi:prolyl-tRNA synthetase